MHPKHLKLAYPARRHAPPDIASLATRLAVPVLSLFLLGVSCFAGAPDDRLVSERYLDALAMIESGSDHLARGRAGERSAWQIRPQAWHYTSELRQRAGLDVHPFSAVTRSDIARAYARTLLEDHSRRFLREHGRPPTPGELYGLWNLGFTGFHRRGSLAKCPALTRDAAQRLTNLLTYPPVGAS
jgi:hypothetical protein